MSVRVPRRDILPLSSISESPPALVNDDSEDNYPFRTYPLTKKNGSKSHSTYSNKDFELRSLNDNNEESGIDDILSLEPSIETFESYDFDDEPDSAYSSIESEEGNFPEFHLLLEGDRGTPKKLKSIFPHVGDKSTKSTTQIVNSPQCNRTEHSKEKKQKATATCSRHPESRSSDDDSNKDLIVNRGQKATNIEENAHSGNAKQKSNVQQLTGISSNSNVVPIDVDLDIVETNDDGLYEDLLQVISSESQRDHKEKVANNTAGADKEDSVDTLYSRQPEYFGLQVRLENFDTDVGKAYEASLESKSLSPLIKEELKCLIQCRRLQNGQPEFVVEPEQPKEYKLTEEEIRKKHARLEQNRRSSKKTRHRARTNESVLLKYIEDAQAAQTNLTQMANQLRQVRDQTVTALRDHLDVCTKLELVDAHKKKLIYMSSLF